MSKVYHVSLDHLLATAPIYGDNFLEEEEIRQRELEDTKNQINALLEKLMDFHFEDK